MFLVGGGILTHGVPALHHGIESAAAAVSHGPLGGLWEALTAALLNAAAGIVAGGLVLAGVTAVKRLRRRSTTA